MNSDTVVRHTLLVRLNHWLIAISGLMLVFSGFGELPIYGRYGLASLPGMAWTANFGVNLVIHYIFAFTFTAGVFFHLVYHSMRREFALLPKKGDFSESFAIISAMLRGKEEPPHDKFLAEQRLAYLAMGGCSMVLILTGLFKSWKNTGYYIVEPLLMYIITMTHTMAAMLFLMLIFAHLGAFILKANRPLFFSMFTGRVPGEYARKRHPKWKP